MDQGGERAMFSYFFAAFLEHVCSVISVGQERGQYVRPFLRACSGSRKNFVGIGSQTNREKLAQCKKQLFSFPSGQKLKLSMLAAWSCPC